MSAKHMSGPWSTENGAFVVDREGRSVADCAFADRDDNIANARLIAASPDLLEALRDILRIVKAVQLSHGVPGHRERIERAEAAIAKATGAQP